ncbi:hypothetical protein VKI21_00590 [Cyanobacterium aponinum UTEX 3222]|uniref:Uncharacterized protein n=1 Tax=Cyanobacterium aponinum AL20115 TaxID=3090662 RepID=A0AAF1C0J4_9CHRO|nr:hypothetical protein [Cyanobacterium aponinum]WPF87637.1 hypothetical protein SAY89_12620 [Cyanobacterium aponinum AL20115]WRL39435.1 hypothetical protein VKI22_04900 [Cyanobacterium aponinum UTEX 3221]WRL42216.1 hypothetical protein VKI21_00590 [Cyanobacterium aponinum UTEX 3222]
MNTLGLNPPGAFKYSLGTDVNTGETDCIGIFCSLREINDYLVVVYNILPI